MSSVSSERFSLELVPNGAVLLDLDSGLLFHLNQTAAFVWEKALRGIHEDEIVSLLVATFDVSLNVARGDVSAALSLSRDHEVPAANTDFRYERVGDGYQFLAKGVPVLEISESGDALRFLSAIEPNELFFYLRAISPRLIALRGGSVLHGSAVLLPAGTVLAFLGASGAGKTTTAQTFAARGFPLVCEDKLVLRPERDQIFAVLGAEPKIRGWLVETHHRLLKRGAEKWNDTGLLDKITEGPAAPVAQIAFLDKQRREGESVLFEPLGAPLAATEIFRHAFFGSSASSEWRRQLRAAAQLGAATRVFMARMPAGIEALRAGIRNYTENMAS